MKYWHSLLPLGEGVAKRRMRVWRLKQVSSQGVLICPSGTFSQREKGNPFVFFILFLSIINTAPAFSWNALGHRLITQIAYDNLTRHEKSLFNKYNRAVDDKFSNSLVSASIWLDTIRYRTHAYDAMHYIDIPFSTDGTPLPSLAKTNAVTAIEHSIQILRSPQTSNRTKGIALRILIHVIGDIHQPLHTATRISWHYPEGDRGGNLVVLHKNKVANNLHAYWDKGAGLFIGKKRYGAAWVKKRAAEMEARWPCDVHSADKNAFDWAKESHEFARNRIYDKTVNDYYQYTAKKMVEQRVALAGCRLAAVLHRVSGRS